MNHQKILILRLSSIGDIVLSSAFIRQVSSKFPDSRIDYIIKNQFSDLVKYNPHITNLIDIKQNDGILQLFKIRKNLKRNNYDYVFDLHNNFRTRILLTGLYFGKKSRIKKNKIKRAFLVWFKWNLYKHIKPIPLRYMNVGKKAGVIDDHKGLELHWNKEIENRFMESHPELIEDDYFVLAPGAGFYTKKWPIEYFMELVESILNKRSEKIVIVGGQNDIDDAVEMQMSDRVINFAGKLSLIESAIVLKKSRALVANDSGITHIAAAVGTPVTAIFGSTVKEFGFFPFRSKYTVVENIGLSCRPCSHIGKYYCPKGHFRCMLELEPDQIYNELVNLN